jgi:hypothetical protein
MKRWLLFLLVMVVCAALALTAGYWLPPLLAFVGAHSDIISGLQAGVQIVLWLATAIAALLGYLGWSGQRAHPVDVNTGGGGAIGGTVDSGGGDVALTDKVIMSGDAGMSIGRSVNTGGGAYIGHSKMDIRGDVVGRDSIRVAGERGVAAGMDMMGPVITGDGNVVGDYGSRVHVERVLIVQASERFVRSLQPSLSVTALRQATEEYLRCLLDRHRYLNLRGLGVSDRIPLRLPLLDVYVPLKARLETPEGETWRRGALRLAGREVAEGEIEALAGRLGEPQPALDLLQKHDGLIILGDPGAGKTTFLKMLALRLALGEGEALGLGDRLPLLLPLSAYATALAEGEVRLEDLIASHYCSIGSDLPLSEMVAEALASGRALVLLDGLDEVRETGLRHTVVERVVDFYVNHRRAGNKFVLTSRIVGYRKVRPLAQGLGECTLIDFDDDEIAAFVARWTAALERQVQGETAISANEARRERQELLVAIQDNPGVRRLAANPLLLTILVLMKR